MTERSPAILKQYFKGMISYTPSIYKRIFHETTGGTSSARYCYSVWLRHLVCAYECGMHKLPHTVAELGPGDSLGIGMAALISGAEHYVALDVVAFASSLKDIEIFDSLIDLFSNRARIPDQEEWPNVRPRLASYKFPDHIFTPHRLRETLKPNRLRMLRQSIKDPVSRDSRIHYRVPWYDDHVVEAASVDFIYSQAVLEHVDDLTLTYRAMARWLRREGYMSHTIDFGSHNLGRSWDSHWSCSDRSWRLIRGRRAYLINRQPASQHLALLNQNGFEVIRTDFVQQPSTLNRKQLAKPFRSLNNIDLQTRGMYMLARRQHTRI